VVNRTLTRTNNLSERLSARPNLCSMSECSGYPAEFLCLPPGLVPETSDEAIDKEERLGLIGQGQ